MILPVGARERLQEGRPDARFRGGYAGAIGVGRVPAEAEQALGAELGEAGEVGGRPVDRRLVELVVAGQQDRTEVGVDCDRTGVGDRVRHVDHLDPEAAGPLDRARLEVPQRHVTELVLLELRADHADRQPAAVDGGRDADLAEDVGKRADMVLVAVGEDDRLDVVELVAEIGEVRQDEIDPEHLGGREHQPRVDDHDLAAVLDHGHVLADLAEPAERQDPQLAALTRPRRGRAVRGRRGRRPAGRRRAAPSAAAFVLNRYQAFAVLP